LLEFSFKPTFFGAKTANEAKLMMIAVIAISKTNDDRFMQESLPKVASNYLAESFIYFLPLTFYHFKKMLNSKKKNDCGLLLFLIYMYSWKAT